MKKDRKEKIFKSANIFWKKTLMPIKVFYNKSCKICKAEINHYKKLCRNNIEWIDITNNLTAQKMTSKPMKNY